MNTKLREMRLSDLQLKTCTRWRAPDGVVYLEIQHTLPFYRTVAAGAVLDDVELGTPPEFEFACKQISSTGVTPGTLIQIQWPDGRYLSNPGVDFFSFVGTGRRARGLEFPKRIKPASKIRFNIDNSGVPTSADLEIYFEGVLRVPLVPNNGR
jgi:hypothetical protein